MRNVSHFKLRFKTCLKIISAFSICLIFFLSNLIFINLTAFADGGQSDNTVKAGVFNFEGYHDRDKNGNLSGYGIEFLNLVSKYSDINFEYTGYDKEWNAMLPMLQNGEIDVVTSASKTEDREKEFDFSLPIGRRKTVLSIRNNDTQHRRGEYNTYNGMKVGLVEGSSQNEDYYNFKEEKELKNCTEVTGTSEELAAMLQKGEIDAILSSNLRKATNEKELEVIKEADFYAIVKKGDPKGLLPQIDDAIRHMYI